MKSIILSVLFFLIFLTLTASDNSYSIQNNTEKEVETEQNNTRDRVTIHNGTVVTDKGTLLRGCRISTDISDELPPRSEITAIKQLGLNSIHLYAESFVRHEPGDLCDLVDSLVNWTQEDSLYLVITIGCIDQNGSYTYDFATGFWNFYAPRYADRTHVIYEIHNEPHAWTPPYPDSTLNMEEDVYNIIRTHAPETHVLFFSYAIPDNTAGIFQDIEKLGSDIDWTNSSIAIHGYGVTDELLESVITEVQDSGYSVVNTEPPNIGTDRVNFRQTSIYESNHVSYLHFLSTWAVSENDRFKDLIEYAMITWEPDFGDWPPDDPPITALDAFSRIEAEYFITQGGPSGVRDLDNSVGYISNGDYVVYNYIDFKNGAQGVELNVSSGGTGGLIEIRLDSVDGTIIGEIEVEPTGGWENWVTKTCAVDSVAGIHRLAMTFSGGEYDLFNIDWFKFSALVTGLDESPAKNTFSGFRLDQNYPNPANSSTIITYSIPGSDYVSLIVYDLLGNEVRILVSEYQLPGEYSININTDTLPDGIYFCKLQVGSEYKESRKMILRY